MRCAVFLALVLWFVSFPIEGRAYDEVKQCKGHPAVIGKCYWARVLSGYSADGVLGIRLDKGSHIDDVYVDPAWVKPKQLESVMSDPPRGVLWAVIGDYYVCPLGLKPSGGGGESFPFVCIEDAKNLQLIPGDDPRGDEKVCAFAPIFRDSCRQR
jgi:hypothetical protein